MKHASILYSWDYRSQKLHPCTNKDFASIIVTPHNTSYQINASDNPSVQQKAQKELTLFYFALKHTNICHKIVTCHSTGYSESDDFALIFEKEAFKQVLRRFT
jgi:hypothetical protein